MPSTTADAAAARRKRWIGAAIGLAVSATLLVFALRGVDFSLAWDSATRARPLPLLVAVVVATSAFVIRTLRWRLLLRDAADQPLPLAPLWHATAAGFMANNILPFRAGEVLRAYVADRLTRCSMATAISSIAVERVFDGLTVVFLLVVGLVTADLGTDLQIGGFSVARGATTMAALAGVALLGAVLLVIFPRWFEGMIRWLVPWPGPAEALVRFVAGIARGISALRSPARLVGVVLWSLVHWLVNAFGFWVAFTAFGIDVSFAGALVMQGILLIGIAAPSTPGYVGVFEFSIIAVLAVFGVPQHVAASYALTYHVLTFVPITLLGLWSLSRASLSLAQVRQETG